MTLPDLVRGAVPSGAHVRRLTEQIQGARTGRGLGGVLADVWYVVTVVVALGVVVYGTASVVQEAAVARTPDGIPLCEAGALLAVLAVVGGVVGLGARLGPVALGGGGAGWWLPMPVDRRGLLRPSVLRWPGVALAAGAVVAPLSALCLGMPVDVGAIAAWAALGGSLAAAVGAACAVAQERVGGTTAPGAAPEEAPDGAVAGPRARRSRVAERRARRLAAAGDLTVAVAVAGLAVLLVTGGWDGWHVHRFAWVAAPLVLVAAGLTVLAERGTEALDGAGLRRLGALGQRAQVAVLALDLRELGRADRKSVV